LNFSTDSVAIRYSLLSASGARECDACREAIKEELFLGSYWWRSGYAEEWGNSP
jgi:hypothetical protein